MAMKAASKTGASGFGALSAPELELLIGHIALLDQATDKNTQLRAIEVIDKYYGRAMADYDSVLAAAGQMEGVSPATLDTPGLTTQMGLNQPPPSAQRQRGVQPQYSPSASRWVQEASGQ